MAEEANIKIAEIEGTILQASHNYWTQTVGNIFSISEDLWNIIQSDMENQVYHIQALLVDELDNYKGKENKYAEAYIKEIQDAYKWDDLEMKTLQIIDKEKQQVQDKKVFLYKPYNINEFRLKTPKLTFICYLTTKLYNLKKNVMSNTGMR